MAAELKVGVLLRLNDKLSGPAKKAAKTLGKELARAQAMAQKASAGKVAAARVGQGRRAAINFDKFDRDLTRARMRAVTREAQEKQRAANRVHQHQMRLFEREASRRRQMAQRFATAGIAGPSFAPRGTPAAFRDSARLRAAEASIRDASTRDIRLQEAIRRKQERDAMRAGVRAATRPRSLSPAQHLERAENLSVAAGNIERIGRTARGILDTPLRSAVMFEAQMTEVGIVSGASADQMEKLTAQARDLGAKTRFSAMQAAQGQQFLSMAGFSVQQTMESLPAVLDLAAAKSMDLGTAADIATNIMTPFKIEASEMTRVADAMTVATASANLNVEELGEAMKMVAPVANQANVSMESTTAMVSLLANSGIKGTLAGTALRKMILSLQTPSTKMGKIMKGFGEETKKALETQDFSNLAGVMSEISAGMKEMSPEKAAQFAKKLFGIRAVGSAKTLDEAITGGDFGALFAKIQGGGGAAAQAADKQSKTRLGQLKASMSKFEGAMIDAGNSALPVLTDVLEGLNPIIDGFAKFASENPKVVRTIAQMLAGLVVLSPVIGGVTRAFSAMNLAAAGVKGYAAIVERVGSVASNSTTALGRLSGTMGLVGLGVGAATAGFAVGTAIDRMFGLSDAIAGVNREVDKFTRGNVATLGSLTDEERGQLSAAKKDLASAQAERESFGAVTIGGRRFDLLSDTGKDLFSDSDDRIAAAKARIDEINARGIQRQKSGVGASDMEKESSALLEAARAIKEAAQSQREQRVRVEVSGGGRVAKDGPVDTRAPTGGEA